MEVVLTIAGSDSSGGAGIQADLRTLAALGFHGASAVTAVTAQNSRGVTSIHAVPPLVVAAQIDAVVAEFDVRAAKTGMLATAETVETVAACLSRADIPIVVVDPVLASTTGTRLLEPSAIERLQGELIPMASCVTPNRAEAEVLSGRQIESLTDAREAAQEIVQRGAQAVVITGGHLPTADAVDVVCDGRDVTEVTGPRLEADSTRGTGCTFSAALATSLAEGKSLADAVESAKSCVTEAIRHGVTLGSGSLLYSKK